MAEIAYLHLISPNIREINNTEKLENYTKQLSATGAQVVCLQETLLTEDKKLKYLDWKTKQVIRGNGTKEGGVSISIDTNRLEQNNSFKITSPSFNNLCRNSSIRIKIQKQQQTIIDRFYIH